MRTLIALLLCWISLDASAQTVLFAGNLARADVPPGYEHYFEERRKTLVLVQPGGLRAEVRFTFNSLREYLKQKPNVGRDFIQYAATKQGKTTFEVPENGGIAFIDFTREGLIDGRKVQDTHGMMGLQDGYFTFTISVPHDQSSSEAAKALLNMGIRSLLGRLRSNSA